MARQWTLLAALNGLVALAHPVGYEVEKKDSLSAHQVAGCSFLLPISNLSLS